MDYLGMTEKKREGEKKRREKGVKVAYVFIREFASLLE